MIHCTEVLLYCVHLQYRNIVFIENTPGSCSYSYGYKINTSDIQSITTTWKRIYVSIACTLHYLQCAVGIACNYINLSLLFSFQMAQKQTTQC